MTLKGQLLCNVQIKKENGKLQVMTKKDAKTYHDFMSSLEEGDVVEAYYERLTDNATLGQLAKVHAMIRELATHTGTTFAGMKLAIKKEAGLFSIIDIEGVDYVSLKSFGDDCSKEDLSLAIQACIEMGERVGCIMN